MGKQLHPSLLQNEGCSDVKHATASHGESHFLAICWHLGWVWPLTPSERSSQCFCAPIWTMSWSQFEGRVCWWPLPVPTGLCNIAWIKVHKDTDEGVWCRQTWVTITESGRQPDRTPFGGDCKQDLLVQNRCFWKRGQEFPERHS